MRLSVIIPTHNRCSLLREAVDSVVHQQITPCEVIVCDDGSTEDMSTVCDSYPTSGVRLVWSRTEERRGAQVARNRGLALAQGEAVMFLDSDDALAANGILPLLQALKKDSILDYVYGKIIRTDEQLRPLAGISPIGAPFSETPVEIAGWHWPIMGAVYKRSYLEKVGPWNEALTGSQDWEYQARVKLAGGRGQFVDTVVGYWREHGGSRVGTRVFRRDYVESVIAACLSIARHAKENGKYDRALAHRLARKMFVHGLEFSVHGFPTEARHVFEQIKQLPEISPAVRGLMSAFSVSPRLLNLGAFKLIRATR